MVEKDGSLLQWWGTNYRRKHFGEDYWVNRLDEKLQTLWEYPDEQRIVIADTRFPEETAHIRAKKDGLLLRVNAERPFEETGRDDEHESETALDGWTDWDGLLWNDFTPSYFEHADQIFAELNVGKAA